MIPRSRLSSGRVNFNEYILGWHSCNTEKFALRDYLTKTHGWLNETLEVLGKPGEGYQLRRPTLGYMQEQLHDLISRKGPMGPE